MTGFLTRGLRTIPRGLVAWLAPVALLVAAVGVVEGRFVLQARDDLGAAEAARGRGEELEAIRAYADALRMYVPASPFERRALDGLRAVAFAAAAAHDAETERRAWEGIRDGLAATRSLLTPFPERWQEAERRLLVLDEAAAFPPAAARAVVVDRRAGHFGAGHLAVGPTLVALLGFAVWIGAVVLFVLRGAGLEVRPRSGARARSPLFLPILFAAGFALFLCGLRFG